jgi:hypothetical protein
MKYVCVVVSAAMPFTNSEQRTTEFSVIGVAAVICSDVAVGKDPSNVQRISPPFCGVSGSIVKLL